MNDALYHYGVPGMKWGRRKAASSSNSSRSKAVKATSKKVTSAKKSSKKKAPTRKTAAKTASVVGKVAKFTVANVMRYQQNQHTMNAVKSFLDGDFGSASMSNWQASIYNRAGSSLFE